MDFSSKNFTRLSGDQSDQAELLGPLAGLVGRWHGANGWNLIAVPSAGSKPDEEGDFQLIFQPYTEQLEFTAVGAPVRNRGGESEQFIGGLLYKQTVQHTKTSETLHVENGLWLNLAHTMGAFKAPYQICRTASIPHGDTAMLLGEFSEMKAPRFEKKSAFPPAIGDKAPLGYSEPYHLVPDGTPFDAGDINAVHEKIIAHQHITKTIHFKLDTDNGGGVLNIPFVEKYVNTPRFQAEFWLEDVANEFSRPFQQLQYTQFIDMFFHKQFGNDELINWPHVNVNTLVKV